jgi:hypothetical protein
MLPARAVIGNAEQSSDQETSNVHRINCLALTALACAIAAPAARNSSSAGSELAIAKTIAENAWKIARPGATRSPSWWSIAAATPWSRCVPTMPAHTMENARRKAIRNDVQDHRGIRIKQMATRPVRREQTTLPNVSPSRGLPIKVGNDVVSGVGLSGSPGVDEPCVNAGIDKVRISCNERRCLETGL